MATALPIYLFTMEYPPMRGGAGVYCEEVAYSARNLDLNLKVIGPRSNTQNKPESYLMLPVKGSQNWTCSFKAYSFLKQIDLSASILHLAEPGALRMWIRLGWRLPKPRNFLITLHGSEIPKFSQNPIEKKLFIKLLCKTDKIHLLSGHNQNALLRLCPNLNNKVLLQAGAPARKVLPKEPFNKVYKQSGERLILLCVARIHPRKGQLELLQALKKIPEVLKSSLTCKFAGPVSKRPYAKKLSEFGKSVGCKVEFLGDLADNQLRDIYKSADLFALTSIPSKNSVEGFGVVYLEASAHGLPILAHRIGGVEDAVLQNKTGLLADPDKPNELIENLINLLEDAKLRKSLGQAGVQWAAEHDWGEIAKRLYTS